MNYKYGAGGYGLTVKDAGAVVSGAGSLVTSSAPKFTSQIQTTAYGTMVCSTAVGGTAGQVIISASSIMEAAPHYKTSLSAQILGNAEMIISGDIAWKGQQGAPTTWIVQRQHPNG